jgi:hypothetical protein
MQIHRGKQERVTGIGWYRPEQWQRLLEISVDADRLENTHAEWLAIAEKTVKDLEGLGVSIVKVDVDVEELRSWSQQKGVSVDGNARAEFIADKVNRIVKPQ